MCNAYTVRPKLAAKEVEKVISEEVSRLPSPLVRRMAKGVVARLADGELVAETMRWGFPHSKFKAVNNARSENLRRGMWAEPFKTSRCLVPISWFYEWQERIGGVKQAFQFQIPGEEWLWAAGLFQRDELVGACYATITTDPPPSTIEIHDRLIAIVSLEEGLAFLKGEKSTFAPFDRAIAVTPCTSPLKKLKPKPEDPQGSLF